jgi:esterase/lipase superfamily enzyme
MLIIRSFALMLLAAGLVWIASTADAHAGIYDQGAGWLIGMVVALFGGGAAAGATGYHVVQKAQFAAVDAPVSDLTLKAQNLSLETVDVYKVWYATNRELVAGEFTSALSKDLRYGDCQVAIPKSHKFGSLGSSRTVRALQRFRTGSDDLVRIVKRSDWSLEEGRQGFLKSAKAALSRKSDQILLYIHGYNVSFDNAMTRAAQIGFDLNVRGITAAFCWASKGSETAYMADEDTIRLSARQLADFLVMLKTEFPNRTINIIAHSMGNRGLIEVLDRIESYPELSGAKFGQIILAAPDIDAEYFRTVANAYPRLSRRTTLYVCSADRALQISGVTHANVRIGYCPPVTVVPGIDTIEATNVNLDRLGHSYYAEAATVLNDMYILLNDNKPPAKRPCLVQNKGDGGAVYWTLRASNG